MVVARAFSSEVDIGSRAENASNRKTVVQSPSALRIMIGHIRFAIGLGEQQHAGVEPAVMDDRVFGIA